MGFVSTTSAAGGTAALTPWWVGSYHMLRRDAAFAAISN
jgi:hypothetical protein